MVEPRQRTLSAAPAPSAEACDRCTLHAESVFRIEGMCCGEEASILRRRLQPLSGVEDVVADVIGQRLHVKYDAAVVSTNAIVDAVAEIGMRAWLEHEQPVTAPVDRVRSVLLAVSATGLGLGLALSAIGASQWSVLALATAAVTGGISPALRAWRSFRALELDINVLMVLAVIGAMVLGEWAEAATVVFLFAISQWLESRTMERAREAIRALIDLAPDQARITLDDEEILTPIDRVAIGAVMIIRPGEKIPLDGKVFRGRSEVNQAPITGESLPIDKTIGDEVFAGTINGHGAIAVTVTKLRRDSTLARIVHLVETAQAQRAPAQQFIDRFARWYTPAMLLVAIGVAIIGPLIQGSFEMWFYRALVLLVVSCPCALVISTPVSVISALAGAARRGVLIKGGIYLERLAGIRLIAFDKTGTLTRAALRIVSVESAPGVSDVQLLAAAASVERRSEHPIASAILAAAAQRGLRVVVASEIVALPGLGARGTVDGETVVCGNVRLFRDQGLLDGFWNARADAVASTGASPVLIARNGRVIGLLGVADEARDVARDSIDLLRRQGLHPIVMLTGDQPGSARAIGARLGMDEVQAGLLPDEKVMAIRELRRRHGSIAMVGDGVNDAPALAAADVGIAMGAIGSAAALETADVALMSDELPKIAYAIRLSRATVRNIHVNVTLSLVLKAAFLAFAIGGVATLWMAVVADTGASLLVVANAMRLLRYS